MKKLIALFSMLVLGLALQAQSYATASLVTNTLTSVIATKVKITQLVLTASSANDTTFKFYDLFATSYTTNWTNAAYYTPVVVNPHTTTALVTNRFYMDDGSYTNLVFTNTFTGIYQYWTNVASATIERPRTLTFIVPASSTRTISVTRYLKAGLCAQANHNGLVEAEYEAAP
jgi:hypothetical protein